MKQLLNPIVFGLAVGTIVSAQIPADSEIRKILTDRVVEYKQATGVVAGVIDAQGSRVIAYGTFDQGDPRPVDGDTVFEIGSVTKVFTGLLLAEMAERGEVALDDPVSKFLPKTVKMPERGGKQITLIDLATHTSGLPRLPSNLNPRDQGNPYADYTVAQLYEFLSGYTLTRDIGSKFEYSNLGGGLLGHVLALRAGKSYEDLVKERITGPLGMKNTSIALSDSMKARLAVGHNGNLERVSNWDLPTLAGAGALRSTANDMLIFLAANLGYKKTPLAAAMAKMAAMRRQAPGGPLTGIVWQIQASPNGEIVWHNGGTAGYATYLGYDAKARAGVVVLANAFVMSGAMAGVDDIGMHLLNPQSPLNAIPRAHKEVTLDSKILDRYVGRYRLGPDFVLAVTRVDNQLLTQATGQGQFPIFPESETGFYAKVAGISIDFHMGDSEKAKELVLHQAGANIVAPRIEGDAAASGPQERKIAAVDPKLFDAYAGKYEISPAFAIEVTRDGAHLFVQATGQPKFEVFPSSDKDFFLKVVDAQITFETGPQGKATGLVLHQNGIDQLAKRVE